MQLKNKQVITLQNVPENASDKLLFDSKEILLRRLAFISSIKSTTFRKLLIKSQLDNLSEYCTQKAL